MCGLAGFYDPTGRWSAEELRAIVAGMAETLRHRGPDDGGDWLEPSLGLGLGHRRLAIQDLSVAGKQPMASPSGRLIVVFNGEIYNFRALAGALEELGYRFRGHSDTEVLVAALEAWGLNASLSKLQGMYAFVLWDRERRVLHLARDRLGKKPLYVGRIGRGLAFASELKSFQALPEFSPEVDRGALTLFLRDGNVPAPYSIFRGILKLPPATRLSLQLNGEPVAETTDLMASMIPYWSLPQVAADAAGRRATFTDDEAVERFERLLARAVAERMTADVPLGAFLSGGVDSSTVVALMQRQSDRPIRTFSIGLVEARFDEAKNAKRIALHLGTQHTELYVSPDEARTVIPRLADVYDEPFGDSSQIPTMLISELARREVTVALSGDGGDEMLGGYRRYLLAPRLERVLNTPVGVRRPAARMVALASAASWRWNGAGRRLPSPLTDDLGRLADLLSQRFGSGALHQFVNTRWRHPSRLVLGGFEPETATDDTALTARLGEVREQMMLLDEIGCLPNDILVKVDRASMAASLEVRAPLLDHRLVEFVWRLPLHMKIRAGQSKWILRQVLHRYVPPALIESAKRGFGVPVEAWLRGPLRGWAEDLLEERRLVRDGFLDPRPIRARWVEHLSGRRNWSDSLWSVLMFQMWRERWL
jgi:asparagine synthase (glutamine-hydrolysing)